MQLGVFLSPAFAVPVAQEAERLGFAFAAAPEGFRADSASVLGAVAASTRRIALASGLMQIPARTPVLTALTAATLDELSGGRFHLGIGVSNPDVSAGWYGVDYDKPLARTREYVGVVRLALSGAPVRYAGKHFRLPSGESGDPAQLRGIKPRPNLPVFIGGIGSRSIELAGEIGDGWIGAFCSPDRIAFGVGHAAVGRARVGRDMRGFEVLPSIPIGLGVDRANAAAGLRHYYANFLGMGRFDTGIYTALGTEMGFGDEAKRVHVLCKRGERAAAAAAVPLGLIEQTALLGDVDAIAARMVAYDRAGVTTLGLTLLGTTLSEQLGAVRVAALAAERVRG